MTVHEFDVEYVAKQIDGIVKRLRSAADDMERHAKSVRDDKNFAAVGSAINDLIWLTPNLGITTLHTSVVREIGHSWPE